MRHHLPVCVAAVITVLWVSLSFVIPGCKALPLPTDQQELPRTEDEWVRHLNEQDWKTGGWNPRVSDWKDYDPTLFCGSPFASNPSLRPGSPLGGPPAAQCPVEASSHGVHLEAPPTTHQVASQIHGESYTDPSTSLANTHTGKNLPSGRQPRDTNPGQITIKVLNKKWLRYLSSHAKYATFWKKYQENFQKKRQELSEKGGTEEELDQKLEQFQLWVYRRHKTNGVMWKIKLHQATPILQDELEDLEGWERLGGDDRKDSKFQKALKEEEEKLQAQVLAVDPLKPEELDHKDIKRLMLIFRLERKQMIMTPDTTSEWAKWMPAKELVDPEDLDIYFERELPLHPTIEFVVILLIDPKYTKRKKEWTEKWCTRASTYEDRIIKLQQRMIEEGRQAEIPEALADYREELWIRSIQTRRSEWVAREKIRKGVKGYSPATRERIKEWELGRGDHVINAKSHFMRALSRWRKEYRKKGVHSPVELDNLLWMERGKRMTSLVKNMKKRKHTEMEAQATRPRLIDFDGSEAALWLGRKDLDS
ncbi:hypothetical protein H0H93_002573 [Arthromyces matolae]|nr:hypothetical protein H0H93_002573 [Arthromyces matolae]